MELIEKDYKKINKLRRGRGYNFESSLVKAFNDKEGWTARRLGGSSTGLPDIVVTENNKSILYAIECKSGESNILYIPQDQIDRCRWITDNFLSIYDIRHIVFAFKFKGTAKRKLQYRIILIEPYKLFEGKNGVGYNLSKEQFTTNLNRGTFYTNAYVKLKSIAEFVNFL
jgi:Holliday junction resolvase